MNGRAYNQRALIISRYRYDSTIAHPGNSRWHNRFPTIRFCFLKTANWHARPRCTNHIGMKPLPVRCRTDKSSLRWWPFAFIFLSYRARCVFQTTGRRMTVESRPSASATHRNLVIVRAGDNSLHRGWGAGDPECKFDLIVSYYGTDPSAFRLPYENRVDYRGGKWDGIHALLTQRPELLDRYRYIWLPDDDLEADRAIIEGIFANMSRLDLHVGQPALTLDSYYSHLSLLRCKSFEFRFVNMIEIMAPCLRADVATKMMPLFKRSMSGFGLDVLWTRLAKENHGKSAVFDALPVRHTRPVGIFLASTMLEFGRTPAVEFNELQSRYGFDEYFPVSYEAVDRKGRRWRSRPIIGLRMVTDYLLGRKNFRQTHRFKELLWRILRRQCFKQIDRSQIVLEQ